MYYSNLFYFQSNSTITTVSQTGKIIAITTKTGSGKNDDFDTWWRDDVEGLFNIWNSMKWKEFYLVLRICAEYDGGSEDCCLIEKLRTDENAYTVEFVKE